LHWSHSLFIWGTAMAEIHRVLELLGVTVASLLDRVESLERDNEALRVLMSPSPFVPVADVPVRVVTGIELEQDRE